jgi:hypothetical protein
MNRVLEQLLCGLRSVEGDGPEEHADAGAGSHMAGGVVS